ncbi:MAG: cupin domain-containing protein [Bacteroidetes bacterium]|nr:cupin domain-containing protein [Bacteroidota bacterium]
MKILRGFVVLGLMMLVISAKAQTYSEKELQPDSTNFPNVYVKALHSDERTSVFLIMVKDEVKAHKHDEHTETVTVISGKAIMTVNGVSTKIKKGDVVIIPKSTAHSVKTTSRKPLKVISVQAPKFDGKDRIWIEDKS